MLELGLTSLFLLVIAFALYGSHVMHGSFYYDDWANAADTAYPPHPGYAGALQYYFSQFGFRPLLAFYVPTLHEVLGLHEHWHIVWSILLLCAMSVSVYILLRTLGLERIHALAIAALALVFPFSDSSTLWSTAATGHLVGALYFLGLALAARALRAAERGRALRYHAASLSLYAAAVTTYELVATVALGSVLVYLWRGTVRQALTRFAADVVVIGLALLWTESNTAIDEVQSTGGGAHHLHLLVDQGLYIVAQTIDPFGSPSRLPVLAAGLAVLVLGGLAWRLLPGDHPARSELRRWLAIATGGLLFAYAAWMVFIPADPYYEPTTLGVGNRVNCVAAAGLAVFVYGLAMIVATLAFCRGRPSRPAFRTLAGLAIALVIGIGFADRVRTDIGAWDLATKDQNLVFAALRKGIPTAPAHSTLYVYGFPNFTAPGVPSFAASWDLNGAVKVLYNDGTLRAYPIYLPSSMVCGPKVMYPNADGYTASSSTAYGHAYLVDAGSAPTVALPRDQSQCETALGRRAPGAP